MLKQSLNFFKRLLTSRLGYLLVAAHLIVVVYIFAKMAEHSDVPCHEQVFAPGWSTIAGRSFHWTYEPLLTLIFILDLPAVFVSGAVETLFLPSDWCDYSKSWFFALTVLFFASVQWQLVGFGLEQLLLPNRKKIV